MKMKTRALSLIIAVIITVSALIVTSFAGSTSIDNKRFSINVSEIYIVSEEYNNVFYGPKDSRLEFYCYDNSANVNVATMITDEIEDFFAARGNGKLDSDAMEVKTGKANGCSYIGSFCGTDELSAEHTTVYIFTTKNYLYEIWLTAYENYGEQNAILEKALNSFCMNDVHFDGDTEKRSFDFSAATLPEFEVVSGSLSEDDLAGLDTYFIDDIGKIITYSFLGISIFAVVIFSIFLTLMIVFIKKYAKKKKELDELKKNNPYQVYGSYPGQYYGNTPPYNQGQHQQYPQYPQTPPYQYTQYPQYPNSGVNYGAPSQNTQTAPENNTANGVAPENADKKQ